MTKVPAGAGEAGSAGKGSFGADGSASKTQIMKWMLDVLQAISSDLAGVY